MRLFVFNTGSLTRLPKGHINTIQICSFEFKKSPSFGCGNSPDGK